MYQKRAATWMSIIGVWNMAKFNIFYSPQYEKGRERAKKRGLDIDKLDEAVETFQTIQTTKGETT